MRNDWKRVTSAKPCPICGRPNPQHNAIWCLFATDGGAAICPFVADGAKKNLGAAGYLHSIDSTSTKSQSNLTTKSQSKLTTTIRSNLVIDWYSLVILYTRAAHHREMGALAANLGVTPDSLVRLGVGRCDADVWTFPMRGGDRILCGVRTRTVDGKKASIRGSKNGYFVPSPNGNVDAPLLVSEGPTDCAALLTLGFDAIGRADCNTQRGIEGLCAGREVVIVADRDEVGQRGAEALEKHLEHAGVPARIVVPPEKDVRQWLRDGVTCEEVCREWGLEYPKVVTK